MANSDKNIVITPNRSATGQPNVIFTGNAAYAMTLRVADDNSLSFENKTGQLFSIGNNVSTGTIFSVNDISGIPAISVNASGNIALAAFGGNVGIGTATPLWVLDVVGNARVAGNVVATSEVIAYYSDARLKSNIIPITGAMDKVSAINGVYYNPNQIAARLIGEDPTATKVGLIAQEVESVLPQVIKLAPFDMQADGSSITGENYKTLQYERVVPLLVEAIKELNEKIVVLEHQVFGKKG